MSNQNQLYWSRYTYNINDPAIKAIAEQFNIDEAITSEKGQALADLFNEIDKKEGKGNWVCEHGVLEWNFANARAIYRGPNSPNYPTKGNMKNVLILSFSPESVSPSGLFYVPYND